MRKSKERHAMQSRLDRVLGNVGLFLIVLISLAVDRLPQQKSGPIERLVGFGARLLIGAVGLIGRICDRLSGIANAPSGGLRRLGTADRVQSAADRR
jgi:hypothetical protein